MFGISSERWLTSQKRMLPGCRGAYVVKLGIFYAVEEPVGVGWGVKIETTNHVGAQKSINGLCYVGGLSGVLLDLRRLKF